MTGPLDAVVPDAAVEDILAVVREALTNVAKHARADTVAVTLAANTEHLVLEVVDDGVGLGDTLRRSGLDNLARRAAAHGGTCTVEPADAGSHSDREGTHLRWLIPLP